MMQASVEQVPQHADLLLSDLGYHPATDQAAYFLLFALAAKEEKDRSRQKPVENLRTTIDNPYQTEH